MKKFLSICLFTLFVSIGFSTVTYAATASIDKSNASNGTISVSYSGASKGVAIVEKGGTKYNYVLSGSTNTVPLQMGAGEYTVSALENVGGNQYKPITSETFSVGAIDDASLYTSSINLVDFKSSTKAVPAYKGIAGSLPSTEKINSVYLDIIGNYIYDFDKAANVSTDYVPVIDATYTDKKGICYDYSVLNAGVLRSQGIPTKLVMGYAADISEYHAWNEIYMNGKWVVVDTTYDSQMKKAGREIKLEKDASKYKVVKVY